MNAAQGKENTNCVKSAGKGTVANAQACLTTDSTSKVFAAEMHTMNHQATKCVPPPDFGFAGANAVNAAAHDESVALVADIFGTNLSFAAIGCAADKAGCTCQAAVSTDYQKIAAAKFSEFVKCTSAALKQGATDRETLADCVMPNGIAADAKGKVGKAVAKLATDIIRKCRSNVLPGRCSNASVADLSGCVDTLVECRVCRTINAMANLDVDCDLFDDGLANETCEAAITCGQTVEATLDTGDTQLFGDGTFTDAYTFTLAQTASVEITMTAGFGPYLALYGPNGTAVSGTSSVQASSLAPGTYTVIANNFS
ncbi:MAG: hypothetical protein ACRDL7_07800, partial [Gaiellaceae bacterium]